MTRQSIGDRFESVFGDEAAKHRRMVGLIFAFPSSDVMKEIKGVLEY